MSKKHKKRNKILKVCGLFMAFVLVIGATVAVTLALMNKSTDVEKNTFVGNAGLDLKLEEPEWKKTGGGEEMAKNYTPGMNIPKDPILINMTKSSTYEDGTGAKTDEYNNNSEYVAIKLEYQILKANVENTDVNLADDSSWQTVPYKEFNKLADIKYNSADGFNSTDWEVKAKSSDDDENTIFYYKAVLPPDITGVSGYDSDTSHKTKALFDHVAIKKELKSDTIFNCPITSCTDHFKGTFNGAPYTNWTELKKALDAEGGYTITASLKDTYSYAKDGTTTYVHVGLIPFRINIQGYAIQAYENKTLISDYKTKLDNLIIYGDPDYVTP